MSYVLRPYQQESADKAVEYLTSKIKYNGIIVLPTGCHGKGTEILLFNGVVKKVEDIQVGDMIMGPDGTSRTVLNLCRGNSKMYEIIPHRGGKSFVVNEDHVLSLVSTNEGKKAVCPSHQRGGETTNISVKDYLNKSKSWKYLRKLHRKGINHFPGQDNLPIDPWFLGVLLGDGCMTQGVVSVTTIDPEIINGVQDNADMMNLNIRVSAKKDTQAVSLHLIKKEHKHNRMYENSLMKTLRYLDLADKKSGTKFIPHDYKVGSVEARYAILAGLLDTDGSLSKNCYDFISKSKLLAKDTAFIARSLGFCVHESIKVIDGTNYYRLSISGDTDKIPCRISRKIATPRRQIKNYLRTGFKIEECGYNDFYGFTLDRDHLYLTADFTVHHNSGKSLVIAEIARQLDDDVLILQPGKEILEQNHAKYLSYGLYASIFSASKGEKKITKVTFGTIGSVINKWEAFDHFKYIIVDECHFVNPKEGMYKTLIDHLRVKVLGLTATPYRLSTDGYGGSILKFITRTRPRVFKDIIHYVQIADLARDGYLAPVEYMNQGEFNRDMIEKNSTGADFKESALREYLETIGMNDRTAYAVREFIDRTGVIAFVPYIENAEYVAAKTSQSAILSSKTPKKEREQIIADFRSGKIKAIINVGILTTGFDYPELDTIIMARPTMSLALYYQQIGRGIRPHDNKESCLVVDLTDNYKKFGPIADLWLYENGNKPYIASKGKQLTNVYFEDDGTTEFETVEMPFGKHRGKLVKDINVGYLKWSRDNCELREPLKSAVTSYANKFQPYLGRR